MKRKLLIVLPLLLVLGALSTLAVAWACAAWVEVDVPGELQSVQVSPKVWENTLVKRRFGHTQVSFMRGPVRIDPQRGAVAMVSRGDVSDHSQFEQRILAGWPWRAFQCRREVAAFSMTGSFGYLRQRQARTPTEGGIELTAFGLMGSPFAWRALPHEPIWPGVIANTLFYAALWWLILFGPFMLRKVIRRRRGRCPRCAYDLRGDLPRGCPECGWGRETPAAATASSR